MEITQIFICQEDNLQCTLSVRMHLLRKDSWLKLNGSLYTSLDWRVKHMNYGVGRCLELDLTRTNYSETTIILKFNSFENFAEGVKVDLTITGVH